MSSRYTHIVNEDDYFDNDSDASEVIIEYRGRQGLCVIINNTEFQNSNPIQCGDIDAKRLQVLFTMLDFEVTVYNNLTAAEIIAKVKLYSKETHEGTFVLALLSHGKEDVIAGSDDGLVEIKELAEFFYASNCPTLIDTPKIFIIDACRGGATETLHSINSKFCSKRPLDDEISLSKKYNKVSSNTGDFVFVFGTTYGYEAFFDEEQGSTFTKAFCKIMTKAHPDKSFHQILLSVNQTLAKEKAKQTVEVVYRGMKKDYYIKRNTKSEEIYENEEKIRKAIREWIPTRELTIKNINDTIEKLIVSRRDVNISRIVGSTASIGGALMSIAGFALTPVTLGLSLGIAAGGIAIATVGGVTVAGASFADVIIQKTNVTDTQKQLTHDNEELEKLAQMQCKLQEIIDEMEGKCTNIDKNTFALIITELFTHGAVRVGNVGIKAGELAAYGAMELGALALRFGGATAKGVAIAGLVFSSLMIPIDIVEIVRSGWNVGKGNESEAVLKLRKIVSELKTQQTAIEKIANE